MHKKASELLNTVGLSVSPKTRVAEIDIAGRQMIEIARAIATNAKIIILDEPTSSLSDVEIKKLFETVNKLKKQGISFIFVSHRLQEVLTLSDRIYILKDGRLTKELYPENTTEDEIVIYKLLSKTMLKPISEVAPYAPFGKSKTTKLLKEMCQKGVITVEGKGKGTKYIIS